MAHAFRSSERGAAKETVNQEPESRHPQNNPPNNRFKRIFTVRFRHEGSSEEHRIQFGIESSARGFYDRLRLSMHPAETTPVAFVELSVRDGEDPREILAVTTGEGEVQP